MSGTKNRSMSIRLKKYARQRGAAGVEFALSLPLFLILISGVWEVGRMAEVQQVLNNAAREGGRQASTGLITTSAVKQVVTSYVQYGLNDGDATGNTGRTRTQNLNVTVSDLTSPNTDPTAANQLDQLQVTVTLPFKDVRWVNLHLITTDSTILTGTTTWYSMRDKAFPTTITPPAGS